MPKQFLVGVACFFAAFLSPPFAWAANLTLQLYPLTGEIRLSNLGSTPIPFVFYEIKSPAGGLNPAVGVWTSISGNYDASGNGFIDPTNNWIRVSSTSTDLAEGVLFGPGGSLPGYRSIGLGRIWKPNIASAASIVPTFSPATGQNVVPMDKTLAVDGDYNNDLIVDQQDYSVWRILYGTSNFPMADGNHNGVVDAADYTVWRDHFGQSARSNSAAASIAIVPEPDALTLLAIGSAIVFIVRRR